MTLIEKWQRLLKEYGVRIDTPPCSDDVSLRCEVEGCDNRVAYEYIGFGETAPRVCACCGMMICKEHSSEDTEGYVLCPECNDEGETHVDTEASR